MAEEMSELEEPSCLKKEVNFGIAVACKKSELFDKILKCIIIKLPWEWTVIRNSYYEKWTVQRK